MTSIYSAKAALLAATLGFGALAAAPAFGAIQDVKREIELQQKVAGDLERLDDSHAAAGEIALLRSWLDEAWTLAGKDEEGPSREILDRTLAQAELIRQLSVAAKLTGQARSREAALAASREKVTKTKQAFQQALIKKKALEMNTK